MKNPKPKEKNQQIDKRNGETNAKKQNKHNNNKEINEQKTKQRNKQTNERFEAETSGRERISLTSFSSYYFYERLSNDFIILT